MSIFTCKFCGEKNIVGRRSNNQNAYFHHIIGLRIKTTGNTFNDEKTYLKMEHGYYQEKIINGKTMIVYDETSQMDKRTMSEFIDKVYMQTISEGINVLTPQEYFERSAAA